MCPIEIFEIFKKSLQLFYVSCVIKGIITNFRSKYGNLSMQAVEYSTNDGCV